ncbi:MAG: DEAD/DEAH box helicase family protein, partial [Flavobacteriaceae bacterium]|nr:DEAD/DEAH box helicase family protein [Flavobacteriaceae bacterium]
NLKSKVLNNATSKEKGDIFELITKYYLLIDPIYRTKLKNVWLLNEVPNSVKKYLNLPDNDEGIDLISQTKDDEYWAIQCKYRTDEDSSITRDDIATFLDVSNNICRNISHKLVCSTANRQSYKFDKFYDDKISFLLANVWNELDEGFFSQVKALTNNKIIPLQPYKPKEHQVRAIDNAYAHFEEENNTHGKLIMACGSGKSLAAYWIAQKLEAKTILIAVPSLALIKQTLEVWTRESIANNIDINWLAVCSDDTVSQLDDDIFTATTKELGIDVSTDIDYIVNWLQNTNHTITIVFTTYQSSKVIAEASNKAEITYDFGIMDEAHKTVGLRESLFSHLLFDKNISIKKRLFMTATERRYKGTSDDIVSMDDIELYGEDFEVLTFREALEAKPPILCDYKIVAMMVTQKEVAELIENNNFVRPESENYTKEIEAEMLASTVALHKAIKKYGIKHTISFHSSIERARFFQTQEGVFRQSFSEYTDLDTFHVSGQTPTSKRNRIIDTFSKSENSLITNARCLTEGVDVPNIDCVLFADPRQSTVDIVQAVGRALRLAKDKEFGYVLVPILIDDENIDIDDIQNKSFQAVISILRALASSDDRIIDY